MPSAAERPSPTSMRPETELLILCARTRVGPEAARRITELLTRDLDWIFLVRDALSHDLLPLVFVHLTATCRGAVPAGILDRLGYYFDEHVRRNARLVEEMLRLLGLLDAHSIPALPFKGPVLAVAAYGDVSLRSFCDLDFLIRRRDAQRAKEVFQGAGYRLETPLEEDGSPTEFWKHEYHFHHEGDDSIAELRWRFTPRHLRAAFDFESLRGRRQVVTLDGVRVPTLAAEDMLVSLCVHGNDHYWAVLKWICDVAELVGANPHLDWRCVEARARRLGCWRMVALGLRLASDLLDAPVPNNVLGPIRGDARVSGLAARAQSHLLSEEEPGTTEGDALPPYHRLEILERWSDRMWLGVRFAERVLTVTGSDRRLLRLPGPLGVGYYALRIIRLLAKYGLIPLLRSLRSKARPRAILHEPRGQLFSGTSRRR